LYVAFIPAAAADDHYAPPTTAINATLSATAETLVHLPTFFIAVLSQQAYNPPAI
jgi:hypothetical protein